MSKLAAKSREMPERLCIIPARGGSKRLARKNIVPICGRPLLSYSVEVALRSGVFDAVVVSTEDVEIADVAEAWGAKVHRRDPALATDAVRLPDVCLDLLDYYKTQGFEYEEFCLLQPAAPLRTVQDLIDSHDALVQSDANYVVSIADFDDPPFWALYPDKSGYLKLFWGDQFLTQRQNLPKVYRHNGSIIWAKTRTFQMEKEFLTGSKIAPYLMPLERSVEVDYPFQVPVVEELIQELWVNEKLQNR